MNLANEKMILGSFLISLPLFIVIVYFWFTNSISDVILSSFFGGLVTVIALYAFVTIARLWPRLPEKKQRFLRDIYLVFLLISSIVVMFIYIWVFVYHFNPVFSFAVGGGIIIAYIIFVINKAKKLTLNPLTPSLTKLRIYSFNRIL